MTDTTPAGGVDMARQLLAAYRKTAKDHTTQVAARRTKRTSRREKGAGHDPQPLAAVLEQHAAENGWDIALQGGGTVDRWNSIAPELAGKVHPAGFDEATGTLVLQPVSAAYATQLRLFQQQLIGRIREKTGNRAVRALRILPPRAVPAGALEDVPAADAAARAEAPVKSRETASDGYKATREAFLAHRGDGPPANPYVLAALERQDAVLADLRNREPEDAFTDAVAELERVRGPEVSRSEQARRAALAFKHNEAANGPMPVHRAFDVA
jgi:predicted nucleic acid-binding Zn ribbon protein